MPACSALQVRPPAGAFLQGLVGAMALYAGLMAIMRRCWGVGSLGRGAGHHSGIGSGP